MGWEGGPSPPLFSRGACDDDLDRSGGRERGSIGYCWRVLVDVLTAALSGDPRGPRAGDDRDQYY